MGYVLFAGMATASLLGIVLSVLQLPGTWLILLTAVGFDAYHHWHSFGWKWLLALAVAAGIAEVLELLASALMAKRAGASTRASIGALVGGFAGMIVFSVPIPLIGTVIGGLIGCFVGALAGELTLHDNLATGSRVGFFAALGRLTGMMIKTGIAFAMAGVVLSIVWRSI